MSDSPDRPGLSPASGSRRADAPLGLRVAAVLGVIVLTAGLSGLFRALASELSSGPGVIETAPAPEAGVRPADDRRSGGRQGAGREEAPVVPTGAALGKAWRYARARDGSVSIAVVDTDRRLRGRTRRRGYPAASAVKAVLLIAELRRLEAEGRPLDPETKALLDAMVTRSDNDAADVVYARVGDAGMLEVARRAGMTGFTVAGHWGNAELTAADLARLFAGLDQALAGTDRQFALGLLGSVVPEQSWGIPAAARPAWAVRFKGGWRPGETGNLVVQAAELRDGERTLSMAVLTDAQPTHEYGVETIRGVTEILLTPIASPAHRSPADGRSRRRERQRSP